MEIPGDYIEKLRSVFNLCDSDGNGYITVEHFVDLAQEHFGAEAAEHESMRNIINLLDPEGDGQIHFPEFCQGVKQIMQIKTPTSTETPAFPPVHSNRDLGSQDTLVPVTDDSVEYENLEATSEVSTFNEYDINMEDDVMISSSSSSLPPGEGLPSHGTHNGNHEDDRDSAFSAKLSDNQDCRVDLVTDEEEKFEFYTGGDADETSSTHRALSPASSGGSRRVTSNTLASQLFKVAGGSINSRRSSCSEDIYDDIDSSFVELNDKVHHLEAQIQMLQEKQVVSDERTIRLKEENLGLVERVHLMEEQLREVELKSLERLTSEQRKHREQMARTEKDKSQEIDLLTMSLQRIEKEYESLKDEAPRLRSENERLKKENSILESRVSLTDTRLAKLTERYNELEAKVEQERTEMEQERKINSQLLDELSKELEDLRAFKQHSEGAHRARSSSLPRSQRRELESQIIRLKTENQQLRDQYEEIEAQMLSKHVAEGRSLLQAGDASIADEIHDLPRDELMKTLKKEQEANKKLREYVDQIVLRILEKNPSILEIEKKTNTKKKK